MAKKTKKKKKDSELVQIQKLANETQLKIQQMVNSANKQNQDFNSTEAATARAFNAEEAEKARLFNAEEAEKARLFDSTEAATAREFNASEAQKTRDYEKMMSDTSHQREVADLKAAGLNPVLSVNGGAASYTGASASASPASGPAASGLAASATAASAMFESGAASAANVMSSLMSGIVGIKQSKQAASATKYAADQSLKAARESAAATRYAADRAYQAVMDQPRNSLVSLVDKYFGKSAESFFTDRNKRKGLFNILKDKSYSIAVNSPIVKDGLQRFGISLEKYNRATQTKLRKQMLNIMLYGSNSANKQSREKWNYAFKFLTSFKRYAR